MTVWLDSYCMSMRHAWHSKWFNTHRHGCKNCFQCQARIVLLLAAILLLLGRLSPERGRRGGARSSGSFREGTISRKQDSSVDQFAHAASRKTNLNAFCFFGFNQSSKQQTVLGCVLNIWNICYRQLCPVARLRRHPMAFGYSWGSQPLSLVCHAHWQSKGSAFAQKGKGLTWTFH